ncbi:MAG: PEP-CTERM sorting domain-containing protein [Planctomycetota bacterium]|nr:PEP-CTERM sorting domain-containing protein [Planctomycetota bacterium]
MIIKNNSITSGWLCVILPLMAITACLAAPAYCQTGNPIALMIQQSPPDGGTVTPDVGVHDFAPNSEVTLTAVPKPGYQFVYWLGDVSDVTSTRAITYLNTPKIIIAVFERNEYAFMLGSDAIRSIPMGGLYTSAGDYGNQGGISGEIVRRTSSSSPKPPEETHNVPVPEPVPEPVTGVLLILGGLLTSVIRRKKM